VQRYFTTDFNSHFLFCQDTIQSQLPDFDKRRTRFVSSHNIFSMSTSLENENVWNTEVISYRILVAGQRKAEQPGHHSLVQSEGASAACGDIHE
jgi:hypothetical protein